MTILSKKFHTVKTESVYVENKEEQFYFLPTFFNQ